MLRGRVSPDEQALITVDIHGKKDRSESLEVVIDTGFTGDLTLLADTINRLGLLPTGQDEFELVNGEHTEFQVYLGSVAWHGRPHKVYILESECDPLLGMTLLWDSRTTIDATPDGQVTIEQNSHPTPTEWHASLNSTADTRHTREPGTDVLTDSEQSIMLLRGHPSIAPPSRPHQSPATDTLTATIMLSRGHPSIVPFPHGTSI